MLGLVLLAPVPLFAASGLALPLPGIVQRAFASLLPGIGAGETVSPAVRGSIQLAPGERVIVRATAAGPVPATMLFGAPRRSSSSRRVAPPLTRSERAAAPGTTAGSGTTGAPKHVPAPGTPVATDSAVAVPAGGTVVSFGEAPAGDDGSAAQPTKVAGIPLRSTPSVALDSSPPSATVDTGGTPLPAAGPDQGISAAVAVPGVGAVAAEVATSSTGGTTEATVSAGATLPGGTPVTSGATVSAGESGAGATAAVGVGSVQATVGVTVSLGGSGSSGGLGVGIKLGGK